MTTHAALFAAVCRLQCNKQQLLISNNRLMQLSPNLSSERFMTTSAISEERKAKRQAALEERRARKKAAKAKQEAVKLYQDKILEKEEVKVQEIDVENEEELLEKQRSRSQLREELLLEAGAMSRSLFRTCLRCVKIMRKGNEHDEEDFQEREKNQFQSMKDAVESGNTFSMAPPVDRENELTSRANYYHGHTREHFDGDSDCLKPDPWREENVDLYLEFLRSGEHKRRWIMNDYKFDDSYAHVFDEERTNRWEARARGLLKETYDANGWILPSVLHSTEFEKTIWEDDDDDQPPI